MNLFIGCGRLTCNYFTKKDVTRSHSLVHKDLFNHPRSSCPHTTYPHNSHPHSTCPHILQIWILASKLCRSGFWNPRNNTKKPTKQKRESIKNFKRSDNLRESGFRRSEGQATFFFFYIFVFLLLSWSSFFSSYYPRSSSSRILRKRRNLLWVRKYKKKKMVLN